MGSELILRLDWSHLRRINEKKRASENIWPAMDGARFVERVNKSECFQLCR